jgi:hypothetical protein
MNSAIDPITHEETTHPCNPTVNMSPDESPDLRGLSEFAHASNVGKSGPRNSPDKAQKPIEANPMSVETARSTDIDRRTTKMIIVL